MGNLQIVGRAYIESAYRPIYKLREIRMGEKKGHIECTYRYGFYADTKDFRFKKIILDPKYITIAEVAPWLMP